MIIALTGLAGAGKSTAAAELARLGFVRIRFADPLKSMLRALGLGHEEIEGSLKEKPCALLGGATPRHAMQTMGTEWGRKCMDPDFWVRLWQESALAALREGAKGIVAEDCRFENEAQAAWRLGGQIWRVARPGLEAGSHESERGQAAIIPDHILRNDAGLDELRRAVQAQLAAE